MSKGGKVQETQQQKALATYAKNLMDDYRARWLPVQRNLATSIQNMGKADSAEREGATGRAATDVAASFEGAQGALEKSLTNNGVNVNSSRAKLATTGMAADAAKATGLNSMIADQQIDDAYTKGLTALTAIGRGERADVGAGLASQARQSAVQSAADAEASASERSGYAQIAGQAAGYGLYGAMNRVGTPGAQPAGMGTTPLGAQADGFYTNPFAGP